MPTEYDNVMFEIKSAQKKDKTYIAFDGVISDESIDKLESDGYTVRSFNVTDREKPTIRRTVIAWGKR